MTKQKRLVSILIFSVVVFIVAYSAEKLVVNALEGETNFDLVEFALNPCEPIEMEITDKMVVLRIDDIQGYAWAEISQKMIDDAQKRGIVPVLGVIPKGLEEDIEFYSYLRKVRCNTELALHGWDHINEEDEIRGEFSGLSKKEARDKVEKGLKVLEILNRRKVKTFIPPNNEISDGAREILENKEFIVSSFGDRMLDYSVSTYDYPSKKFVDSQEVVKECERFFEKQNLCIIMTHPQNFVDENNNLDEDAYSHYLNTLDKLIEQDASFVTFEHLLYKKWISI
jgi:predicted deacetylase